MLLTTAEFSSQNLLSSRTTVQLDRRAATERIRSTLAGGAGGQERVVGLEIH